MPAADVRLCPKCNAWPISDQDATCGLCAAQVGQLRLELELECLDPETVCPIQATIINPTCKAVKLDGVRVVEYPGDTNKPCNWAKVSGLNAATLAPGARSEFTIDCVTNGVPNSAAQLKVDAEFESHPDDGIIVVSPEQPPPMVFDPTTVETWPGGPSNFNVRVFPETGIMRLRKVASAAGSWLRLNATSNEHTTGHLVSRELPLELPLQLNSERFGRIGPNRLIKEPVELTFTYAGLAWDTDVAGQISLRSLRTPEFRCPDETDKRRIVTRTDQRELTLRFQNGDIGTPGQDRGTYRILDIRAADGSDWSADCSRDQKRVFPLAVPGGQRKDVTALLDLRRLPPGDHDLTFQVDTDLRPSQQFINVPIRVKDLDRFKGKLVVDFGTTNTCAALVKEGTFQPFLQNVDTQNPLTTSATAIQYLSLKQDPPLVKTGNEPQSLVSSRVVRRLKQRLGDPLGANHEAEQIYSFDSKLPVDRAVWRQAADYLREVRRKLEHTEFFPDIVLTHPAICSLTHFRNMKKALAEAFPDKQVIRFLQEPIAALTPFMYEKALEFQADVAHTPVQYAVAAFDMGGGTTDVTIVRVRHRTIGEITQIEPTILSSWGERFGGEDLTDFIAQQVRVRCEQLLQGRNARLIYGAEEENQEAADANRFSIARWAEDWKIAFTGGDFARFRMLELAVGTDRGNTIDLISRDQLEACLIDGLTLPDQYRAYLMKVVGELIERLLKSDPEVHLDFIQLSGKSTQIPAVEQAVSAALQAAAAARPQSSGAPVRVVRADQLLRVGRADLKECVVYGAALWFGSGNAGSVAFAKLGADQRTTSRIGLTRPDIGFDGMIKLDQVIPPEGLWSESRKIRWEADTVLAVYENLSEQNDAMINGAPNPAISLSMQFEAEPADGRSIAEWSNAKENEGARVDVQLRLTPELELEAYVKVPGGARYRLRQL